MTKPIFTKCVSVIIFFIAFALLIAPVPADIYMQKWGGVELTGNYYITQYVTDPDACENYCLDSARCKGATYDPTKCRAGGECPCYCLTTGLDYSQNNPNMISFTKVETGTLDLSSTPTGARVILDGYSDIGTTPQQRQVDVGSHLVEFQLEGYEKHQANLNVVANQTTRYQATLDPKITAPPRSPGFSWVGTLAVLAIMVVFVRKKR